MRSSPAFDADWLQDDPLGTATTDGTGHYVITYLASDFRRTPFSPFINVELTEGPDVYVKVELGGQPIITETQSDGRKPGRQNVGHCFCLDLCTDKVVGDPETVPHWQQVEVFDIHPGNGQPGSTFDTLGYADPAGGAYVFGGTVTLRGNCPLTDIGTGHPLKYRFLVGEYTWTGGTEDPANPPTVAPASLTPVTTQVTGTHVGYVFYTDGNGQAQSAAVVVTAANLDADGFVQVDGLPVTVPMYNPPGSTAVVNVSGSNFLRTFDLLELNTAAITALHPTKKPGGLPKAQAGETLPAAEQEPVRRYRVGFEVRDAVTNATTHTDQLDSIIFDNSAVIATLDLEELRLNGCNPLVRRDPDPPAVHGGPPAPEELLRHDQQQRRLGAHPAGDALGGVHHGELLVPGRRVRPAQRLVHGRPPDRRLGRPGVRVLGQPGLGDASVPRHGPDAAAAVLPLTVDSGASGRTGRPRGRTKDPSARGPDGGRWWYRQPRLCPNAPTRSDHVRRPPVPHPA